MKTINYITYDSWWDTDKTILSKLCKDYKVNVFVLNFAEGVNKFNEKEDYGFNVFVQHVQKYRDRDPRSLLTALAFWCKIKKHITKDSLNIFVPGQNLYLLYLLLFLPKNTTCICYHNYIEHVDSRKGIFTRIKDSYIKNFKKFIFYSQGQVDAFRNDNPNKHAYLLNMPLKDYGTSSTQKEGGLLRFLFFGYIRDYKRLDIFIKAANKVKSQRARFVIAGNTKTPEKYTAMINDRSRFDLRLRFIANEEVPDLFAGSDFLVLPYEDSTQSGPSLVALNYSLPIIASDLPSFRSLISEGVNGYLFEFGNSDALANVIDKICELDNCELEAVIDGQRKRKEDYIKKSDVLRFFGENIKALLT